MLFSCVIQAGKPSGDPDDNIKHCMRYYSLNDKVNALKHEAHIFDERRHKHQHALPRLKNLNHRGTLTEVCT